MSHKLQPQQVTSLVRMIQERERIRQRKEAGHPPPWTKDPVLANYRFTNVRREDDAVTQWIAQHWRAPEVVQTKHLWFAMCVARQVNYIPSLADLVFPVPWRPELFKAALHKRAAARQKVFTGAYMINQSVPGGKGLHKIDYVADLVLTPMWSHREFLAPTLRDTLASFHARLASSNGLGSFMAAQVVADMKYVDPLLGAKDWSTWAASGPGSRRGLNIVCGKDPSAPWKEHEWLTTLQQLQKVVNSRVGSSVVGGVLHAQDLQNCLCEFSKYTRGWSRSKYTPQLGEHNGQ